MGSREHRMFVELCFSGNTICKAKSKLYIIIDQNIYKKEDQIYIFDPVIHIVVLKYDFEEVGTGIETPEN